MSTSTILMATWKSNQVHKNRLEAFFAEPRHLSAESERLTLAEKIERVRGAMTAEQLAKLLNVSKVTVFKQAKAGRIPSFRVGTCVRFDPRAVANWLRKM